MISFLFTKHQNNFFIFHFYGPLTLARCAIVNPPLLLSAAHCGFLRTTLILFIIIIIIITLRAS